MVWSMVTFANEGVEPVTLAIRGGAPWAHCGEMECALGFEGWGQLGMKEKGRG